MTLAKLYRSAVDYTQNIGRHEDFVTGMLCACLEHSPEFRKEFLAFLGHKKHTRLMDKQFACETGVVITEKSTFPWYRGGHAFKPDVWLFNSESSNWYTRKPNTEFNLIIESKLRSSLSKPQVAGYKSIKKSLSKFSDCHLLLIRIGLEKVSKVEMQVFGENIITWSTVASLAQKLSLKLGSEELSELATVISRRIYPLIEPGESHPRFIHRTLKSIKAEVGTVGDIYPFRLESSGLPDAPEDGLLEIKWLRIADLSVDKLSTLWLAAALFEDSELVFRLETWISPKKGHFFTKKTTKEIGRLNCHDPGSHDAFWTTAINEIAKSKRKLVLMK